MKRMKVRTFWSFFGGGQPINYLPQRSWAKIMFLHACVILFTTGAGGGAWSRRVSGLGGSGPREGCLVLGGVPGPGGSASRGGSGPGGGGAWWRPPRTVTAVGGTHPTGMHSCLAIFFI